MAKIASRSEFESFLQQRITFSLNKCNIKIKSVSVEQHTIKFIFYRIVFRKFKNKNTLISFVCFFNCTDWLTFRFWTVIQSFHSLYLYNIRSTARSWFVVHTFEEKKNQQMYSVISMHTQYVHKYTGDTHRRRNVIKMSFVIECYWKTATTNKWATTKTTNKWKNASQSEPKQQQQSVIKANKQPDMNGCVFVCLFLGKKRQKQAQTFNL